MNKGGVGGGPTAGAAAAAAQKQKSLLQRVDADIGNIVDNFSFLVNVARVNDPPVRNSQESFMMEMRASRMVQAADSLLKLVSELKQTAIFSGFASLNDHVEQRTEEFNAEAEKTESLLSRIGEEAAASLKELESHYYSSAERTISTKAKVNASQRTAYPARLNNEKKERAEFKWDDGYKTVPKASDIGTVLPSTSMAAHAADEDVEDIEMEEKLEVAGNATRRGGKGTPSGIAEYPFLPPPPPLPKGAYLQQYKGDDVDGLDEETVGVDIV